MEPRGILAKLLDIQRDLKVKKAKWNEFGGYYSRSKEDILEAIKPLAHELGCVVKCDDEIMFIADDWVYVRTTAKLIDAETGEIVDATAVAREPESKPKMDSSQTTGSASSYAGKRALGNLFALDDTADSDQICDTQQQRDASPVIGACTACGTQYRFQSAEHMDACQCQCGNRSFVRV